MRPDARVAESPHDAIEGHELAARLYRALDELSGYAGALNEEIWRLNGDG